MTLVIAHRGASAAHPENTLEAFAAAAGLGADGVELDARRTADDRLVVHHDAMLPDGRVIRATPSDDLPDHVPTLDAALDVCGGMLVNVEIKNSPDEPDHDLTDWVAHAVAATAARRGNDPALLVSSFRLATVDTVRRIAPGLCTAWLTLGLDAQTVATAVAHGHHVVHPWCGAVDAESIRAAHAAGLSVNVWTCNDRSQMGELMAWGVDGICTDLPDVALAVRQVGAGAPTNRTASST